MIETGQLIAAGVLVGLGGLIAFGAREPYERYNRLLDVASTGKGTTGDASDQTTVRGPVRVEAPATPTREPPGEHGFGGAERAPALLAWRVREQVRRGGNRSGTRWRTGEAGLDAGEFTVRADRGDVAIDAAWLPIDGDLAVEDATDPFDSSFLFLGDPEIDAPLGPLGPLQRILERLGLAGERDVLGDWEVSIGIGRITLSPDRYQATVVRDGDDLVVRGELVESGDRPTVQGTGSNPLVIAAGDLESKADRFRFRALGQGAIGAALVLLGVAVVAAGFL